MIQPGVVHLIQSGLLHLKQTRMVITCTRILDLAMKSALKKNYFVSLLSISLNDSSATCTCIA